MILSDETVVLSLVLGVILGLIYLLNQTIMAVFSVKKWCVFLLDFTFAAVCCVITFIGALAISNGTLRFVQAGLEIVGALSVVFIFRPAGKKSAAGRFHPFGKKGKTAAKCAPTENSTGENAVTPEKTTKL